VLVRTHAFLTYFFTPVFLGPLVAQLVNNLPATLETWVGKILWRRERQPPLVFWSEEFHGIVHGVAKSRTRLTDFHFTGER